MSTLDASRGHVVGGVVNDASPTFAIPLATRVRAVAWLVAWLTTWLSFVAATWGFVLADGRLWGAALFWFVLALGVTVLGLQSRRNDSQDG